jgi:hypothetical protein
VALLASLRPLYALTSSCKAYCKLPSPALAVRSSPSNVLSRASENAFRRVQIAPRTMATLAAQKKHKVTIVGSGNWYAVDHKQNG